MVAATLIIHKAGNMTKKGRKDIAEWLKRQAKDLITEGKNYSALFKATYSYEETKDRRKS